MRAAARSSPRRARSSRPTARPSPATTCATARTCGSFSQFSSNYVNAFPLPNLPGAGRNYRTNRKEGYNLDSYDIKIDHRVTDSNSFFARYSRSKSARQRDNFFPLGESPNGNDLPAGPSAGDEFGNSRGFTMGDTHTFGTSIVNDARFGFTRVDIGIFNTGVNGTGGFDPNVSANLGARNINLGPKSSGIILFGIVDELTGTDRATEFTGDGGPFYFLSNNFNFADAVTVVKGNQTLKFGGDLRVRQNSNYDGGRNGGTKTNTQYGTTGSGFVSGNYNGIGPNDTGSSLANFLLGYRPGFITRGDPGGPYFQSNKEIAFFVQDDWKAHPDADAQPRPALRHLHRADRALRRSSRTSTRRRAPSSSRATTRRAGATSPRPTITTSARASASPTAASRRIARWSCAAATASSTRPM